MGLRSEDYGRHLLDVENLLQQLRLVESQVQTQGERVQRINSAAYKFVAAKHPETKLIADRRAALSGTFDVSWPDLSSCVGARPCFVYER